MNSKYPRLSELESLHSPEDNRSHFYISEEKLNDPLEGPSRVKAFTLIEKELSALDDKSWAFLINEAKPLCIKSNGERGRNQLFEKLNEAKGYCFLKSIGCSSIRFIPRAEQRNIETPDLEGCLNTSQVLCEVKTINISDDLISWRKDGACRDAHNKLTKGSKNKLETTIKKAACQLNCYSVSLDTKKFIYLVITWDNDPDYTNELNNQTRKLFNDMNIVSCDLVIHNET